jgi:hypothetical protein
MKLSTNWLKRPTVSCLVLLMAFPLAETSAAMPQQAVSGQQPQTVSSTQTDPQDSGSPNPPVQSSTPQSNSKTATKRPWALLQPHWKGPSALPPRGRPERSSLLQSSAAPGQF